MEANNQREQEIRKGWLPLVIVTAVLAVALIAIIIVIAMNSGKKETTQTEVTRAEESSEEVSIDETVVEQVEEESEQLGKETVEEATSEAEEAVVGTMEQRLTELGLQGICVVVWNDVRGEEHIITEGESYKKVEGDRFFICTPSSMTELNSSTARGTEFGESSDNYREIIFNEYEEDINTVEFSITCQNGEQGEINFFVEDSMKEDQQTGIDWVMSLGYDSPKMVVYNDTTGLRKELEEGDEYQLSEGDIVAMYTPDYWYFESTNITEAKIIEGINATVFDWKELTLDDNLSLEMSVWDTTTDNIVTLHVTLLPPTK